MDDPDPHTNSRVCRSAPCSSPQQAQQQLALRHEVLPRRAPHWRLAFLLVAILTAAVAGTAKVVPFTDITGRGYVSSSSGPPAGFEFDSPVHVASFIPPTMAGHHLRSGAGQTSRPYLPKSHIGSNSRRLATDMPNDSTCPKDCCLSSYPATCSEPEATWVDDLPFSVQIILIVILVSISGICAGLTLGFLSLDKTGLEIVMEGGDPQSSKAAKNIYPIRKKGNLLLCTLLFANVGVNAFLSILMADLAGGLVGFFVSTFLIVIFGEMIPQAACSRYALQIGSFCVPMVKVFILILYPIASPFACMLDWILGDELGVTYSKKEMSKLLEIHVKEGRFTQETVNAMAGALQYQDMTVREVMTPLEHTFMLDADQKLNFENIAAIFKTGYSRIPVYEVSKNNIIGLLFVKDLIFIDPEDDTLVRSFVQIFGRGVHVVWPDDKLGDVLRDLKKGHSHMALVRDVNNKDEKQDPIYEITGIITLEDIIEIILGEEIVDETDAWVDQAHKIKVDRVADFNWARLRLLDNKLVDRSLQREEVRAVSAHLKSNYPDTVELLTNNQLIRMISETPVLDLPASELEVDEAVPADALYKRGEATSICTLILNGKVSVLAGEDHFQSDVSSWSVLASKALTDSTYVPDFSAFVVSGPCRCLRFTRERFTAAVDASGLEKLGGELSTSKTSVSLNISTDADNDPGDPSLRSSVLQSKKLKTTPSMIALDINRSPISSTAASLPKVTDSKREAVVERRGKLLAAFFNRKNKVPNETIAPDDEILSKDSICAATAPRNQSPTAADESTSTNVTSSLHKTDSTSFNERNNTL